LVEILHKANTPKTIVVFGFTEHLIDLLLWKVMLDLLATTSAHHSVVGSHFQKFSHSLSAEDLQELLGDKMYSWKDLREGCREESTRPVIEHCEQSSLQKAHNARIDDDLYHQRTMSETVFCY